MDKAAILPLFYLPPTEFFSELYTHKAELIIEQYEHLPKQTYRNRASIQSPNGKLDLIVPVIKGSKVHTKIKDVRISYDFKWQRLHWMSLQTSYRRSAYFEFYEDDFAPFYEKKYNFLFDYNLQLVEMLLGFLKLKPELKFTNEYHKEYLLADDYRGSINPKNTGNYSAKPYFQVFDDRNGFMPNLSVVDLLFSQGPQSLLYL